MDSEELLSRVKTYDLALIGWVTAMAVRARTVFSLEALSWESGWANLTENRGQNRTNRELEPKELEPRISILHSVPNSQESKIIGSVRFLDSVNRGTEPNVI